MYLSIYKDIHKKTYIWAALTFIYTGMSYFRLKSSPVLWVDLHRKLRRKASYLRYEVDGHESLKSWFLILDNPYSAGTATQRRQQAAPHLIQTPQHTVTTPLHPPPSHSQSIYLSLDSIDSPLYIWYLYDHIADFTASWAAYDWLVADVQAVGSQLSCFPACSASCRRCPLLHYALTCKSSFFHFPLLFSFFPSLPSHPNPLAFCFSRRGHTSPLSPPIKIVPILLLTTNCFPCRTRRAVTPLPLIRQLERPGSEAQKHELTRTRPSSSTYCLYVSTDWLDFDLQSSNS